MIIPKVNIKNILSSDSSNNEKTVNSKEQQLSASPKDYNKEECLNNLWVVLINVLFDENPKTTLKELMSSKKFSNHSYIERSTLCESPKKEFSEISNPSEMNNCSSPSVSNKKSIFRLGGGHSRANSTNSITKKGSKKEKEAKEAKEEKEAKEAKEAKKAKEEKEVKKKRKQKKQRKQRKQRKQKKQKKQKKQRKEKKDLLVNKITLPQKMKLCLLVMKKL